MIIFRYLAKEILHTVMAISAILLLVFFSNLVIRFLSRAADGSIPMELVASIVAIQIPYIFSLLLPLAFFIALLLAYGRMYADSEMTVLLACGMSRAQLIRMTLIIALIISSIVALLMLWVVPNLLAYRNHLLQQAREDVETQLLFPGSFQQINHGAQVVYVEALNSKRNHARNVFAAMHSQDLPAGDLDLFSQKQSEWTVVSAARAERYNDQEKHAQYVELKKGYRYLGTPGTEEYKVTQFDIFGFRTNRKIIGPSHSENSQPTTLLLANYWKNSRNAAELQWRIAMPVATMVLAFLGVALSRVDPRKGKYAQLLPAVTIAIIYANLLFAARSWIRSGSMPPFWGIWWIHAMFFILAIILLYRQYSYRIIRQMYCNARGILLGNR